ncbi:hypothetical protein EON82_11965 [bacterium]|nr:MAG: hypothetical protein EON82_11965 [bacterium]
MEMENCCPGGQCGSMPRRDFLRLGALAVAGAPLLAQAERLAKFVPADKGVMPGLLEKGTREWHRGDALKYIGMPIGGICAGQVYLGGDGRLWLWDIFNQIKLGTVVKDVKFRGETFSAGGGANYMEPPEQVHPFAQGFALKVGDRVLPFQAGSWADIAFAGEYPFGIVEYRDPDCPVQVTLEAYSPFVPLDENASATPAVVLRYTLKNAGSSAVKASIGGWMENPVGLHTVQADEAFRENRAEKGAAVFALVEKKVDDTPVRPAILFEDWTAKGFGTWKSEGTAFGPGAYDRDKIPGIGNLGGGPGNRVVKSYRIEGEGASNVTGDAMTGKLTSREFTIERKFIEFWIGGGNHPKTAYLGLVVDGKLVRSATGRQDDGLRLDRFEVSEFEGKRGHLEIVDAEKGFWGQIGAGQISFVDRPTFAIKDAPDFGEMAIGVLGTGGTVKHDLGSEPTKSLFEASRYEGARSATPARPRSGVSVDVDLAPGESKTISFAVAWRFPNLILNKLGRVGHHYTTRFASASAVIDALKKDDGYVVTKKWHETWYDSSLPRWFLDRTMANTPTLATMTCVRFENGRFYGWEGIGCCDGTCGHVWGYAQTVGRLFPELERTVREMADYKEGVGFEAGGLIDFRGEYNTGYAADAQAGYILRTLREHQTSKDGEFLKRVYPRMKEALGFLINEDTDEDGVLEGRQHNTLDVDLYGPSSWLTSYYLAALRAGEEMAKEMGDAAFAKKCRAIFDRGAARFDDVFWNGSYYIHRLNLVAHPESMRIGNGCECDQVMGQWWAHQIGLGRVIGEARTKSALKTLYKNNFLPDLDAIRNVDKRGRWYGMPGESGLLMCSFPQGDRKEILGENPTWASMYFNEVWTGQEHQVSGHMIHEGLVDEGLRLMKAVHDRHHPKLRNPYNEVECSDHYARGMASYGAFIAAGGFTYHGPKGQIGFAPKIGANDFRSAFTAAEGWGTYRQKIGSDMEAGIKVRHGSLRLKTVSLEIPLILKGMVRVTMNGRALPATASRQGGKTTVTLANEVRLKEGDELVVHASK